MSGTLATALGAVSAVQELSAIFLGGALSLGDMDFVDLELPETIRYGGQQQMTVHKLPGGQRVIDAMGDDPAAISWSGMFFGLGRADRRDQLEAMRVAGDPIDQAFKDRAYTVLIADCQYVEHFQRIEFNISCTVLPDPDPNQDDDDLDDGEPPDTPEAAQEQGAAKVATARAKAPTIPVPPIPPAAINPSSGPGAL